MEGQAPDFPINRDTQNQWHCEARKPHLEEKMNWLVKTIESEIIPRLMAAHQDPDFDPEMVAIGEEEIGDFTDIVLNSETTICRQYIESIRERGVPLQSIYLNLLTPAARRLDAMWVADHCDFTQITVALWRMQQLMYDLSPAFRLDGEGLGTDCRKILLTPVPGSQHTLGILMVAEFFRRAGWYVWGEPLATRDQMINAIADEHFDVVGVSIGSQAQLTEMTRFVNDLRSASRNSGVKILAGGPLLDKHPEFAEHLGADATAKDAETAVQYADQLVERSQSQGRHRHAS